ncbi:4469_t:CDS:2 [Entrophospora sp. SA101]|nr:3559_t:CDS:2 [Entrophospora sp. SA101]CAJ0914723.1 4469_t:CDS:2 [Entrophospora sp. SA101]
MVENIEVAFSTPTSIYKQNNFEVDGKSASRQEFPFQDAFALTTSIQELIKTAPVFAPCYNNACINGMAIEINISITSNLPNCIFEPVVLNWIFNAKITNIIKNIAERCLKQENTTSVEETGLENVE